MKIVRSRRRRGVGARALTAAWPSTGLLSAALLVSGPASAAPGMLLEDGRTSESEALAAGEQLVVEQRNGQLAFAGRSLALLEATVILGYASEVAYAIVVDGRAADGDLVAESGSMLMIPPYGANPVVQRFDAARFAASWSDRAKAARPAAFAALESVANRQRAGLRLGRFSRSRLNITAPGGASPELARRSVKGAAAVQAIRFSGQSDMAAIERSVVDRFLAALAENDAETVAALIDPVPFGNQDLRGGASDARVMMARELIDERDWKAALAGVSPERQGDGNIWKLNGAGGQGVLVMRPMGDFVFIRAIEMGGRS